MELAILLLAMLSPFLYAVCNHVDNILLKKYFKEGGVGTLMLFSALLAAMALPLLVILDSGVMEVSWQNRLILFGVGAINTLLLWAYLQAIFGDDPTDVIIYYQAVPVLGLFMGNRILGETITLLQMGGMALVIVGALYLTIIQDKDGVYKLRLRTAGYMSIAVFCWALESTTFKMVAVEETAVRSFFWEHVSLVILGIVMFTFIGRYRRTFVTALSVNSLPIIGLNVFNEGAYMLGNFIAALVVVIAPVSLTLLVSNSIQPLFVLAIGLGLMRTFKTGWLLTVAAFWDHAGYEKVTGFFISAHMTLGEVEHVNGTNMRQKLISIALTAVGVLMIGEWE